jgi:hypothetical protein
MCRDTGTPPSVIGQKVWRVAMISDPQMIPSDDDRSGLLIMH